MKKPKKPSKLKSEPKGLQGYEQISQSEELKAMLPPGSQIMPGLWGGTSIFIPLPGLNRKVPNFRGPWGKIRKEIFRFEVFVSDDGNNMIPRADQPPKGTDAACDKWIAAFYQDKNRWKTQNVPKKIAPWLIARAMTASQYAAMEDSHGLRPPEGKLEEIMCGLLINFWNDDAYSTWHGIHPDASAHSE